MQELFLFCCVLRFEKKPSWLFHHFRVRYCTYSVFSVFAVVVRLHSFSLHNGFMVWIIWLNCCLVYNIWSSDCSCFLMISASAVLMWPVDMMAKASKISPSCDKPESSDETTREAPLCWCMNSWSRIFTNKCISLTPVLPVRGQLQWRKPFNLGWETSYGEN